jgi:hypothetical protein
MQACGYQGLGRLWPVDGIIAVAARLLKTSRNIPASP